MREILMALAVLVGPQEEKEAKKPPPELPVVVEAVRGDVQYKSVGEGKEWKPLARDSKLHKGDQIQAGIRSGAVLRIGEEILIRIHSSSFMTLSDVHFDKELVKAKLRLDVGSVFVETKGKKRKEAKVMTPHGTTAVRGTSWETFSGWETLVDCEAGRVELQGYTEAGQILDATDPTAVLMDVFNQVVDDVNTATRDLEATGQEVATDAIEAAIQQVTQQPLPPIP